MPTSAQPDQLLTFADIPGKGRALLAARPLTGGQVILRDSPILLYFAAPFPSPFTPSYCAHCFKYLLPPPPSLTRCPSCLHHVFCSPSCLSSALASTHAPYACRSLACLSDSAFLLDLPPERHVQARFLVAAYNLALVSPPAFETLLSLRGHDPPSHDTLTPATALHSLIASMCPPPFNAFSVELTAALLFIDKVNAFGLMEPALARGCSNSVNAERSVRAYGIYPRASMFNHDCLPNACRFDYVDDGCDSGNNTDVVIRMIHDVPQGREICLSYFPVNWSYSSRQKRLREDYGFNCECDRCKVEANWSDNENDDSNDDHSNGFDEMEESDTEEAGDGCDVDDGGEEGGGGGDDFPHAYFFVRFMCSRQNCWGTLAPLPPSEDGKPSTIMECNVCGQLKNVNENLGATDEHMDE